MSQKIFSLELLLTSLLANETITQEQIYNLIFTDGFESLFDGIDITIVSKNMSKLSLCFDLNGDGVLDTNDLLYLKNLNIITISKIVNSAKYLLEIINSMTQVKFNNNHKTELIFRIIVYAYILPLTKNSEDFKLWLRKNNNKDLLIEGLNLIYTSMTTSRIIKNSLKKIDFSKIFSCFIKKNLIPNIFKLEEKINLNIDDIHSNYKINKKLEDISNKLNNINTSNI